MGCARARCNAASSGIRLATATCSHRATVAILLVSPRDRTCSQRPLDLRRKTHESHRLSLCKNRCLRYLLLVMCTHPFAKKALTLHLARSEGHERYFGCNLMHRKVLASSHQHLIAEAPTTPSVNKRGRGEMTKSPITLQELRRRIYVKAKSRVLFIGLFREVLITVLHDAERVISQIEGSRVL